jgi:hypothetical protein
VGRVDVPAAPGAGLSARRKKRRTGLPPVFPRQASKRIAIDRHVHGGPFSCKMWRRPRRGLTPLAASCLVIIMIGAAVVPFVVGLLATFVARRYCRAVTPTIGHVA